ncbi:MAG: ABC transporter permease [Treponema sp.]|nr:ABC transporter permease [Treponema sp.]
MSESGTRLYSDLEVDLLIDEISEAALEAIEQAAGEAAKSAVLSVIEREALLLQAKALALHEAEKWRTQAEINAMAVTQAKKAGTKNAVITGVICFLSGFVTGIVIMGVVK